MCNSGSTVNAIDVLNTAIDVTDCDCGEEGYKTSALQRADC